MDLYFPTNECEKSRDESPITWKLSVHPLTQITLPKNIADKKGKKYLAYFQHDDDNLVLQQMKSFQVVDNLIHSTSKIDKLQEDIVTNNQQFIQNQQEDYEFINRSQRKGFSFAKFVNKQLNTNNKDSNQRTKALPKKNDLSLIRVLTSMPDFKLQKLYRMKVQTVKNVMNLTQQSSKKYITPVISKAWNRRLPKVGQLIEKTQPEQEIDSSEETDEVFKNIDQSSDGSLSSTLLNYRLRNPKELNQTLYSRMQSVQKKLGIDKPKLVVLTDRNRKNLFRVNDKLQFQFGLRNRPVGKNSEEEQDVRDIFEKQNKKNNFFQFQEYFFQNYQLDNKGMQTKLSYSVQERNLQFQQNIMTIIDSLEKKRKQAYVD